MNYDRFSSSQTAFGRTSIAITPSDIEDIALPCKAVVVTEAGSLAIVAIGNDDDQVVAFDEVPVGWSPPFIVRRVMATGTTAVVFGVGF